MGGSRALVLRVFLWEGVLVGLSGVLLGLALGLCACWVIGGTGLITLPDVYSFHENIPVMLSVRDTLTVCVSALLLSVLSGAFPALKAASLDPVRGLRG
jgi:ABC-type lipoprotein release transport system permease subunit